MTQFSFLSEELPAKTSPLQDFAKELLAIEATSHLNLYGWLREQSHAGYFGRMSPVSCRSTEDGRLEPSSEGWQSAGMGSPTGFLTLSISECHKDAGVCSLSDILETGDLPQRYFLSAKACAGILRRAEKRGKALPKALQNALLAVVQGGGNCDPETANFLVDGLCFGIDEEQNAAEELMGCLKAREYGGGFEGEVAYPINTQIATRHEAMGEGTGLGIGSETDPAFTLQAAHSHAVAFQQNQLGEVRTGAVAGTLNQNSNASGRNTPMMQSGMKVRRLTPIECERLQGFPDGYTKISDKTADGNRYKALGNSMAVPVMRWLGERIDKIEKELNL